jgi:diguanylate cyclase (GGDEF)-like protein/PAS domain S-box-containing protein
MSKEHLEAIIDCIGGPIIVKDQQYKLVFTNAAACKMLGRPCEQLIGKTDYELFPKEQADVLRRRDDCVLETGKEDVNEEQIADARGNVRTIATKRTLYIGKAGEKYIVGAIRDITERKRSEESLRASQLHLLEAMDLAHIVYWEFDPVAQTYVFNDPFYAFYGTTAEQEGGYRMTREDYVQRFIHPDDMPPYYQFIEENTLRRGPELVADFEHRIIRRDGEVRHILARTRTFKDQSGRIVKRYGANQDITERKNAEEALRWSEQRFRSLFETSRDSIHLMNQETGQILGANSAACRLYGYSPEEFLALKVTDVSAEPEKTAMAVLQSVSDIPFRLHRKKDGTVFPVEISGGYFTEGDLRLHTAFIRDITDRKGAEEKLRASQLQLAEAADLARIAHWEYDEATGEFIFNDAFYALYGTTAEREGGYRMSRDEYVRSFIHPDDREELRRRTNENRARPRSDNPEQYEHRVVRRDGEVIHVLTRNRVVMDSEGRVLKVVGVNQDITARKKMEDTLRESETKLRAILDGSRDAIGVSKDGIRIFANPAYVSLFGYESADELIGAPTIDLIAPESRSFVAEMMRKRAAGEPAPSFYEVTALRKDGTTFLAEASASTYVLKGEQLTLVILRDITDRKQAEKQLLHNAFYDGLTDLPNRELFMDRLGHALRRANRDEDYPGAVIFLDLDRFKVVNDSLGHTVGDKLLKEAARRLERCIRPGDTVARLGGDEFVMLCERIRDVETAKAIAYRVQDALSAPFMIEGSEIRSSASIGIALTSAEYEGPEEVLRDADITMYRAKALGRARCEVFDPSMRLEAAALLQLENDLRHALDLDEFRIHYQPIVALGNGETTGLEALIRWQHPRRGLVPPSDFIPLAEETGLIVPIGEWVLRTACSQMKTWQEEGLAPLRMSVNVSTVQLRRADFVDMVMGVLAETGVEPGLLDLEVTESVLVDRNESIIEMFHQLKALGIRICLDDFGTGYSSLSYLQGLPIDVLKIDASFTKNLTSDKERGKIVETILMLGKSLGTEVIAEGIETDEQLKYLKAMECCTGQGFFFSKAVDEKAIKAMFLPGSRKSSQPLGR